MKNSPSIAQVFTGPMGGNGTNQGAAAILDQHQSALPYLQNLQAQRAQQQLVAAQQKRQKEKDWNALTRDMPDVWEVDSPYIEQDLQGYSNEITKLKLSGADPFEFYSDAGKAAREGEAKITKRKALADENRDYFQWAKETIDKDSGSKYDKAYAAEWFKKFTDPSITPEERAKLRYDSNPFKLDISDEELVTETVPDRTELEYESYTDPKAHKEILINKFIQDPELFDSKKKEGETIEQTATRLADLGQKMFPKERKKRPVGGNGGGGNGGGEKAKFSFSETIVPDNAGLIQDGLPNQGYVTRTGTNDNIPAIGVRDDNGNLIDWQFSGNYVVGPDGNIGLEGFKVVKGEVPPYPENGTPEEKTQWAMATMNKPTTKLEPTWIDLNRNENAMKSVLMGVDLYDRLGRQKPSKGGQSKPQETEKVATMSEVRAMLKQSPGYTEQELVDYYKSQGYTIKE